MNKFRSLVTFLVVMAIGGTRSQLHSQTLEQQLRSQYRVTRVGANGTVVGEAGTVLGIRQDGLRAIPASYGAYWYSSFKGGRIKGSTIQHGGSVGVSELRPLQVGEKVYLVNLEINQAEMVFYVQSCGACVGSAGDPNDVPYRARLAIEFQKGYLSTNTMKQVEDTIGQVFGTETAQPPPPETLSLKIPSTYVSAQAQGDRLQLNADHSFSLQEGGQTYHGTFAINGNNLELNISESNARTTATVQGNTVIDGSGQIWILQEQSAGSAPDKTVLQNDDVIKMTKAGLDDAIIISKISGSKCQFDTSTNALISLKQSGVSATVLKAMLATEK